VGALDDGRVGLDPAVEQPLPLLPAYLHLLGQVVGRRAGWGLGHAPRLEVAHRAAENR
jgi:hypothetical protein